MNEYKPLEEMQKINMRQLQRMDAYESGIRKHYEAILSHRREAFVMKEDALKWAAISFICALVSIAAAVFTVFW